MSHPVVVDLLQGLVADGTLEDDALEGVALVAGHQLHTNHLALPHRHVAEHLHRHIRHGPVRHPPGPFSRLYLLKVVDHEEDVWVAHLGLLPFAVHGVFAGRREHFLQRRGRQAESGPAGAALAEASYLTFLLVDVDVPGV